MTTAETLTTQEFVDLINAGSLDDFLKKAKSHSVITDETRVIANQFAGSDLAKDFANLSLVRQWSLVAQIPFLWHPQTFRRMINAPLPLTREEMANWVTHLITAHGTSYRTAFWSSVFESVDEAETFAVSGSLAGFTRSVTKILDNPAVEPEVLTEFFSGLAITAIRVFKHRTQSEDFQKMFRNVYSAVGYHPHFYGTIGYPFAKSLSRGTVMALTAKIEERINDRDAYVSWALVKNAVDTVTHAMFQHPEGKDWTLLEIGAFLSLVKKIGRDCMARNEAISMENCRYIKDGYQRRGEAIFFNDTFFRVSWHALVGTIKITEKDYPAIAAIQVQFYSDAWESHLRPYTQGNMATAFRYAEAMDTARKEEEDKWHRETFFGTITSSTAWKTFPIEAAIQFFKRFRSQKLFFSILERNSAELPTDWLMLKFVHNGPKK